ncbi:UDP-3-O-acyl-N-acetylglucosamine deacetylase [Simkania negevensis]|uniref:UDP-3-O-acyl-N-acetylglucosamine deacetylase n=1 Tax=Simkania negevensis TaxID=83561 RepID=A0ABS3AWJ5_9BACT|nr:UDP-3-O-acyl-N-acetylglucosamine deacetylase [Simkania negevensis]
MPLRKELVVATRPQKTLKKEVSFAGIGIHTGEQVNVSFSPAPVDTGIVFQRVDLPGKPTIPATIDYLQDTSRSTNIGTDKAKIHTVEHLLAAFKAYQVDNLCVQIGAGEPPIGDGSSQLFVDLIEESGVVEQKGEKPLLSLKEPIYWSEGPIHLVALPSDSLRISYTLDYPNVPAIRSQYFSLVIDRESFKNELARCRTFSLYEEVKFLMEKGLIKGGSLENGVIIEKDAVFSKDGLRFPNEMVRHKVLDLVGDLSLVGYDFHAHVIAIRSGHAANAALSRLLLNYFVTE